MREEQLRKHGFRTLTAIQKNYIHLIELPFKHADLTEWLATMASDGTNDIAAQFPGTFSKWREEEMSVASNMAATHQRQVLSELEHLPHQEPRAYSILRSLQVQIEPLAQLLSSSHPLPKVVIVGTIPRGLVNAGVIPTEDPDCAIIAFEFGLVKFIAHLCRILNRFLSARNHRPPTGADPGQQESFLAILQSDPAAFEKFVRLMATFLCTGGVIRSPGVDPDRSAYEAAMRLRLATELWCLGHEYGHLLNNHLGHRRTVSIPAGTSAHYDEVATTFDQEHEADTWGVTLGMKAAQEYCGCSLPEAYVGGEIFCLTDMVICRSISLVQGKPPDEWRSTKHPEPLARIAHMRERLQLVLARAGMAEASAPAIALASQVLHLYGALMVGWEAALQHELLPKIKLAPQFAGP